MNAFDRIVLYGQALVLGATLAVVMGTSLWVRTEVEAAKAKAEPAIEMANRIAERIERWDRRWNRLGVPDEPSDGIGERVTPTIADPIGGTPVFRRDDRGNLIPIDPATGETIIRPYKSILKQE